MNGVKPIKNYKTHKLKECSVCGKMCKLWKSNPPLCSNCVQKKKIKKITSKQRVKNNEKSILMKKMLIEFEKFYNNHPTKCCEQTGEPITQLHTYNVHHILPKHLYPQYTLSHENFMLLSQQAHSDWETLRKGDIIQKKYDELKQRLLNNSDN